MSEERGNDQSIIVPIDPDSRYVILMPGTYLPEDAAWLSQCLREWWEGDKKFFVLHGDVRLERIE